MFYNHHSGRLCVSSLLTAVLLSVIGGCGGDSPSVVSGSVTYNGEPVADGQVLMQPVGGKGTSCGGSIKDGKYTVETAPGRKVVRIKAANRTQVSDEQLRRFREAAARGARGGAPKGPIQFPRTPKETTSKSR